MPKVPFSQPDPAWTPDPSAASHRLEALVAPANGAGEVAALRILVVDDSETNRRLAEVLVRRRGFDTVSAADGAAALDRLAAEPVDLVLLDGMMPGLDGPAVAREVRRREGAADLPRIPIVALTASVLPEDRARMLDSGMDDHLAKPLRADDLAEVLDRWLPAGTPRRMGRIAAPPPDGLPGDGPPVLDREAFARLADLGDAQFVERIVRLFLADAAERVAQVDEAIDDHDLDRLRAALHALEGICGILGAPALDGRVRALHDEVRRREERGEQPFGRALGPSGLEPLLDATRIRLQERQG